ncbi:MAG: hypothetical protein KF830_16710 [Planctomycetes bacterium]|nr:hypothetical protein [Planctomycetota bacterium]
MPASCPSLLRLILWPSILTLLVSVARLVAERQGWGTTASGGRGFWLGITWLAFVFGAWFGWRLGRGGATPRVARAWLWPLLGLVAIVGAVMVSFRGIDPKDTSPAAMDALRQAVLAIAGTTIVVALLQFAVWPRLALALLAYAIPARATVLAITWLAKQQGWDTHYTKLGPAGIEQDLAGTMLATSVAQLGFWVPFTVVAGMLAGCLVGGRRRAPGSA